MNYLIPCFLLGLGLTQAASAVIYTWTDANHQVHYSDQPQNASSQEYPLNNPASNKLQEQIRLQDQADAAKDILLAMQSDDPNRLQPLLSKEKLDLPLDEQRSQHTALTYAVSEHKPQLLRWLLAQGAKVDQENRDQKTPLFYAVRLNDEQACLQLLSAGANPNQETRAEGNPLLLDAINRNNLAAMQQLLMAKAQVDAANLRGETALRIAVERNLGETVAILLALDANPNFKALDGRSPYQIAEQQGNIPLIKLIRDSLNGNKPTLRQVSSPSP